MHVRPFPQVTFFRLSRAGRHLGFRGKEVHDELHHRLLFLRFGLGNHHHHGHQCVVGYHLFTVAEQKPVLLEEEQEHCGGYALVPIGKSVVLGDEVKQVRPFSSVVGYTSFPPKLW